MTHGSQLYRETFARWLDECEMIAMEDEWCIDIDTPEWDEWFQAGLEPRQAVRELCKSVKV